MQRPSSLHAICRCLLHGWLSISLCACAPQQHRPTSPPGPALKAETARPGASDLLGASALLRALQEQSKPAETAAELTAHEQFKTRLRQFSTQSAGNAEDLAKQWLAFYDEFQQLPPDLSHSSPTHEQLELQHVVAALPPPSAWKALLAQIQKRQIKPEGSGPTDPSQVSEAALLALAQLLNGDREAYEEQLTHIAELIRKQTQDDSASRALRRARALSAMYRVSSVESWMKLFRERFQEGDASEMALPDLVSLVGAANAQTLVREVMRQPRANFDVVSSGGETRALVKKLVLADLKQLKTARWRLPRPAPDDRPARHPQRLPGPRRPDRAQPRLPATLPITTSDAVSGGAITNGTERCCCGRSRAHFLSSRSYAASPACALAFGQALSP